MPLSTEMSTRFETKKFLTFIFMRDVNDVRLPSVVVHEVDCSACLLVDVLLEVPEVLELLVPSEVDLEVEVLVVVLPVVSP